MSRSPYLAFALCLALVTGCSTAPERATEAPTPATPRPTQATSAQSLLNQAQQSSEPERSEFFLRAAQQLVKQGQSQRAFAALRQIQQNQLSATGRESYILLGAQLATTQGDAEQAFAFLKLAEPPLFQQAPAGVQRKLSELRVAAHDLKGDHLMSAMERVFIAGLYSGDTYWKNHNSIWASLNKAPPPELQHAFTETAPGELKGWLDLAVRMRRAGYGLDEQVELLRAWQQEWPMHPAAQRLPEELQMLANLRQQRPQKLALAIPLSGSLAAAGHAIRDGFLAAYYADPLRTDQNIQIEIIDTHGQVDFVTLYRQLSSAGFDLIIGPLDKSDVTQLEAVPDLAVPTLALNYTDSQPVGEKPLLQLGLAIEDEIAQVTQQAWNNGHRNAAIIVPESAWGRRAYQAFASEWQKLGGRLLASKQLAPDMNYSAEIKDLLAVEGGRRSTSTKADPNRRRDIDCIFLAASPIIARQVKPLLAYHYAGDIPVYATSQVFTGRIDTAQDQDLNGIFFVDLPWTLRQEAPLKEQSLRIWPEQAHDRLFALGIDAYRAAPRINMLQQFPDSSLQGMTGVLSVKTNRQIRRSLDWALFKSGQPQPASFQELIPHVPAQ